MADDPMTPVLETFGAVEAGEPADFDAVRRQLAGMADECEALAAQVGGSDAEAIEKMADFARRLLPCVDHLEAGSVGAARVEFRFALHQSMTPIVDELGIGDGDA